MADDITTIQVHKPTIERLSALKMPGLTYEDVINFALDKIPREEIEALYRDWQKDAMTKLAGASRPIRRRKS